MNRIRRISALGVVLLVLALIASTTVVVAGRLLQETAESEEFVVGEPVQLESQVFIGDDPDEDGYVGAVPAHSLPVFTDPSEADVNASIPTQSFDWELLMEGPQPDEDDGVLAFASDAAGIAAWSTFRYVNVAGATLAPRSSVTNWTYPGAGCISAADGNDVFNIHLPIPNGSRIDYLRIYYYDTSSSNSTAWVTIYNGAGSTTDVTSVSSAGNTGYGTQLSAYAGHVVNTVDNSYVLNWRSNQTGSTMRLCGLRIAYRDPS